MNKFLSDHMPATHAEIKLIMATLVEVQTSVHTLTEVNAVLVSKVSDLKAQVAALQAQIDAGQQGPSPAELDAIKASIDAVVGADQAAVA